MSESELRIGSIYKIFHGGQFTAERPLTMNDFWSLILGDLSAMPIPLTEEWLLRFGFETKAMQRFHMVYDSVNTFTVIDFTGKKEFFEQETGTRVLTVHHLQNLFFAITGNELTIKE